MAQAELDLESLGELDSGNAKLIINAALREAVADLDDRGRDGKERQAVITVRMRQSDAGLAVVHVEAHAKVPARRTGGTIGMLAHQNGRSRVHFQKFDPRDPAQRTIDEAGGEIGNTP